MLKKDNSRLVPKRRKKFCGRYLNIGVLLVVTIPLLFSSVASAQFVSQTQLFQSGIYYFNTYGSSNVGNCSLQGSNQQVQLNVNGAATTWHSGLNPPFYLEEFAINLLEDLAKTTNVSSVAAATQQHVLALVAGYAYHILPRV